MPLSDWDKVNREDDDYKLCLKLAVGSSAALSMVAMRAGGKTEGIVVGAVAYGFIGFIAGYIGCPDLAPMLRKKIEQNMNLTHHEIRSAAEAMGKYARLSSAPDAIKLVALIKSTKIPNTTVLKCPNPPQVAQSLLQQA